MTERPRDRMIGVIDIGSNSLRLVIYDRIARAPQVLFNEKVMCALGRGMNLTGRLNPAGVALAYDSVERFRALADRLGVGRLDVLATSAVRDATDGPDFVLALEARCGIEVRVISGEEEALLSAAGVQAGIPEARGIVGDLGGGSVELVPVGDLAVGEDAPTSLPIGPVRLIEGTGDEARPRALIDQKIAELGWLGAGRGTAFYAVGGAWRALARIHMEQSGYPLHVIQGYRIARAEAAGFLDIVSRQSRRSLEKLTGVSRKRVETLPLAAHVLWRLVQAIEPAEIVFSAFGLREGHLFGLLDEATRAADPLLAAAAAMAAENPRFSVPGSGLADWTDRLFADDSPTLRLWRRASALLSDLAWSEHPDYRAEQAFLRVLRMPISGIDHAGRVFIAAALHARYGGSLDAPELERFAPLLEEPVRARARAVGLALRLAYTISGGAPDLAQPTTLDLDGETVVLGVPKPSAIYTGEAVQRRLEALARALGKRAAISPAIDPGA